MGMMLVDVRQKYGEPDEPPRERIGRRYWTRTHVGECQACGQKQTYKERVYDEPPPQDPYGRLIAMMEPETYCGCQEEDSEEV